jgi:hypothetical protein
MEGEGSPLRPSAYPLTTAAPFQTEKKESL